MKLVLMKEECKNRLLGGKIFLIFIAKIRKVLMVGYFKTNHYGVMYTCTEVMYSRMDM